MFSKIKNHIKRKDYVTIESYFQNGYDIKIQKDEEGKQVIHLRDHLNNRLIEITQNDSNIKHEIHDGLRGITTVFEVPTNVYQKVLNEPSS